MSNLLAKTIEFVDQSFGGKKSHFQRTLDWLLELNSEADIALQIAAYSHDIERAFKPKGSERFLIYEQHADLVAHQEKSAKIMNDFLIAQGAEKGISDRVRHLIEKHEEGGDEDQNLLQDADSISYLETNAPKHVSEMAEGIFRPEEVREKFEYMFSRISGESARSTAKPMYEKVIRLLDKNLEEPI